MFAAVTLSQASLERHKSSSTYFVGVTQSSMLPMRAPLWSSRTIALERWLDDYDLRITTQQSKAPNIEIWSPPVDSNHLGKHAQHKYPAEKRELSSHWALVASM